MTEPQTERILVALETLAGHFGRIVLALERLSPPPVDRSMLKPADKVIRPTLSQLTQWERDDHERIPEF